MVRRRKTPKPQASIDVPAMALKEAVLPTQQRRTEAANANGNNGRSKTGPIYFWREGDPNTGFLSQWFGDVPFHDPDDKSKIYRTAEHYMMHHKALLFNDHAIAAEVLRAGHPRKVNNFGREVKNFHSQTWERERETIARRGNYAKFSCALAADGSEVPWKLGNSAGATKVKATSFRAALLATGDRELIEASPYDRIWGIGYREEDADESKREQWGLNLLGQCLMDVRDEFRREEQEADGEQAD